VTRDQIVANLVLHGWELVQSVAWIGVRRIDSYERVIMERHISNYLGTCAIDVTASIRWEHNDSLVRFQPIAWEEINFASLVALHTWMRGATIS
jgi:hypothetical protein